MQTLLKSACSITGFEYAIVKQYDSWSRRKVQIYALAMLIPTTIWFLNGYCLATKILRGTVASGILVGFICCTMIFVIEKLIVMAYGNWKIGLIRLVLAFSIAILGSFCTKAVIFEKDINNGLEEKRAMAATETRARIEANHSDELKQARAKVQEYQGQYNDLMDRTKKEAVGELSKKKGIGPITRFYQAQADHVQKDLLKPAQDDLVRLNNQITAEVKSVEAKQAENEGLWARINVFIDMAMKDGRHQFVFWVFFTLFLCMELLVWVLKNALEPSVLDKEERLVTAGIKR